MKFGNQFVPGYNSLYNSLVNKITHTEIDVNKYKSPFSAMLQSMEHGVYLEEVHINPTQAVLFDTVTNQNLFTDYTDDVETAVYETNVDLMFPSTYTEHVVRESATLIDNVYSLTTALAANIKTTMEYWRTKLVKQMLYNAYAYGMIDCIDIPDPRTSPENASTFAVTVNKTVDDMLTEINTRYMIYNNRLDVQPAQYRFAISSDLPYVITFNEMVRYAEYTNAIAHHFGKTHISGNNNDDWQRKMITLNKDDFPTAIPGTDRQNVATANAQADGVNFFPLPKDDNGDDMFAGAPKVAGEIAGFIIDPRAIKLLTQLSVQTSYQNQANLKVTNREIYRGLMALGAFNKIVALVVPNGTRGTQKRTTK